MNVLLEESNYYLGFFKNYRGGSPSIIIMTTESQPVSYSIEIPGIGYYHSGTITANNEKIVNLKSVDSEVLSHDDQDKGIYLKTSSDRVTVIGQNVRSGSGDTFLALPITSLCVEEYVYYGMSVRTAGFYSSILIVGTENNTMMKLTVTQPVTIKVDDTDTNLTSGKQHSFVINRLQTVYVRSFRDLTGTKIVTDKPVSVFSGHECAYVPYHVGACDYLIEQVPPTTFWGRVYYTAPLATRRSYTIKVLAAYNSTNVDIYCNDTRRSYTINEGKFINRILVYQEYCVIRSNKKVLVVELGHGLNDDGGAGDPMMTMVPATIHYSNEFSFSTSYNPTSYNPINSRFKHFVNIIVMAQYYQPDMMYLISGGVNKSLDTQEWVPVKVNNVIEAYTTKVNISEGVVEIIHTNTSALMTTIVYGFAEYEGYGHPGGLTYHIGPTITIHPLSYVITNNHNLSLTCKADGATSYNWERQSDSIPSGAIGVNTNTLTIINLQPEDAGNYRCVVTNDCVATYSNYAAISVEVKHPVLTTLPSSQSVDLTQTATFTCSATGYNVNYKWTIRSGSFPSKVTGINTNTLVIPDVRSSDDNTYTCVASNEGGSVSSKGAKLTITGLPEVTVTPSSQSVEVTHTATFTTTVRGVGNNSFTYKWRRGHRNKLIKRETGHIINFDKVSERHKGNYSCYVENMYGDYAASNTVYLTVTRNIPKIVKYPKDVSVDLNSNFVNVTLTCEADGATSYNWKRHSGSIPSGAIGVNTNTLTIINLQPEDAGNYRCVATNASGSSYSEYATIIVKVVSPQITTHPTDTSAATPFSGVFTCSTSGYGYLNITWYRTPGLLPDKSRTSEVYSPEVTISTLVIPNVTNDDVGSYYCVVRANSLGAWSSVAKLSYAGTPTKPTVQVLPSQMISLAVNNFNMSLKCIPDQQDLNYVWEKRSDNLPSRAQGVHLSTLTVINLQPEDSGEYRCVVSNSTGRIASEYQPVTVKVSLPAMITQPKPTTVHVYDTATFQCTGRSYGKVTITWKRLISELPVTASVEVTKISKNEVTSILTIDKSIGYYKGNYYCVIENDVGKVNSTFAYCDVTVPCPEIIHPPQPVIVRPENMVTFSCLAWSYGGLVYRWSRSNSTTLPSNALISFQNLMFPFNTSCTTTMYQFRISKAQTLDEGLYCCIASNECGSTTRCAWLEVDNSPNITVQPQSGVFKNKGENLMVFEVVATDMSPISYKWEKYQSFSNSWIRPSSRAVSVTSSKLIFSVITEEDEGTYHCIVTNDDGSVVSDNVNVTVYGPPKITYTSSATVSFEGRKVKLTCNATNDVDAVHPVQIKWYNSKGKQVQTVNKHILIYSNTNSITGEIQSVLLFDPVNRTDTGMYTCRAYNHPQCYNEDKVNLIIEYAPRVTIDPPYSPHTVSVGTRVFLYCIAEGRPIPTIKWYKNNFLIPEQTSQLYLVPTDSPHSTKYTCEGINNAGNVKNTASASVTVKVEDIQTCSQPSDPQNGRVFVINGGNSAIYTCNDGYITNGARFVQCISGKWSSPPPTCKPLP
ncbi:basement membrane-specific heparan sulfate proteoglycan core protein-like isoform X2 [Dysidea avara]|uniref:basement membrane-specific heparan sulfate proteoglycan core protein-like isoform X2 n=1 Tax=Dysidea avara TaxID=196820 RepID=UPI003321A082